MKEIVEEVYQDQHFWFLELNICPLSYWRSSSKQTKKKCLVKKNWSNQGKSKAWVLTSTYITPVLCINSRLDDNSAESYCEYQSHRKHRDILHRQRNINAHFDLSKRLSDWLQGSQKVMAKVEQSLKLSAWIPAWPGSTPAIIGIWKIT